jgi:hypothetical protein
MKPAKRRKDKLICLDDFDSETGREGRAPHLQSGATQTTKTTEPNHRESKMHRRPASGGGKRNSRLTSLATVISIRAKSQRAQPKRAGR